MTSYTRVSLKTAPPASPASVPKSQLQPLNVRDRPSILCLAPYLVVPNSPNQNHEEDQNGPIEILGVGVGCDGEEHEDEQRSLERKGTEVSRKQKSAKRAMVRRQQYFLIGKGENSRQVAEQAEAFAQVESRMRHRLAGETARYHAANA
jgi:hypothetical protein